MIYTTLTIGKFEVSIQDKANPLGKRTGYVEHETKGEYAGLWFDGKELIDYDGCFELPKSVIEAIEQLGFNADYAKDAD